MWLCVNPAPCIPMNILRKPVLCRHTFGKHSEPVECLAEIQTHRPTGFSWSPALLILSKERMSEVRLELLITNLCGLHTDPVWFCQFLLYPESTQNLRFQLMKLTLLHSSSFKYVKSILVHLYLLVPFLFSKFPLCKFQWGSDISFCDFFQ